MIHVCSPQQALALFNIIKNPLLAACDMCHYAAGTCQIHSSVPRIGPIIQLLWYLLSVVTDFERCLDMV